MVQIFTLRATYLGKRINVFVVFMCVRTIKESPENGGRGFRKEKILLREFKRFPGSTRAAAGVWEFLYLCKFRRSIILWTVL